MATRILIPFGSRSCFSHFDESGNLKAEELDLLKEKRRHCNIKSKDIAYMLNELRKMASKNNIFEKFNDVDLLDDKLCKQISGMLNTLNI